MQITNLILVVSSVTVFVCIPVQSRKCGLVSSEEIEQRFEKFERKVRLLWNKFEDGGHQKRNQTERLEFMRKVKNEINTYNSKPNNSFCMELNEFATMSDDENNEYVGPPVKEETAPRNYYQGLGVTVDMAQLLQNRTSNLKLRPGRRSHSYRVVVNFGSKRKVLKLKRTRRSKRATNPHLPDHVDWSYPVDHMGRVESQMGCACCWAFAASHGLAAIQSVLRGGSGGTVTDYSEQELVNCVYPKRNGCNGGRAKDAWNYWMYKQPQIGCAHQYIGRYQGECVRSENGRSGITGWRWCSWMGDEEGMKAIVAKHPVVVSWYARTDFKYYSTGVYDTHEMCGGYGTTNHAMVVAGYGTDPYEGDYWLLKNSWGEYWGMNGYVKVKRGKNLCNIANNCMYPTVEL